MTKKELQDILDKHSKWLQGEKSGEQAKLNFTDLSGADLSGANLISADLSRANLAGANLSFIKLSLANLISAELISADLSGAQLVGANLSFINLSGAKLIGANLISANLSSAQLAGANLSSANLSGAQLVGANLIGAKLSWADLSGCKGLLDPIKWMKDNLEKTRIGYIAYKSFGSNYTSPAYWKIKPGSEISEVVNPLPTLDCACGVNVAMKTWAKLEGEIWKVLIKWEWLPSVVVPYNTNGKFRCGKVKLLEVVGYTCNAHVLCASK